MPDRPTFKSDFDLSGLTFKIVRLYRAKKKKEENHAHSYRQNVMNRKSFESPLLYLLLS